MAKESKKYERKKKFDKEAYCLNCKLPKEQCKGDCTREQMKINGD